MTTSPDVVPLQPFTMSWVGTQRARAVSPRATAGQGFVAPVEMSVRMLGDQAAALVNACVVYTCRPSDGSTDFARYAARLSAGAPDQDGSPTYEVTLSEAYNYVAGVEVHDGPDVTYPFPAPDWVYIRLVETSVHQTEMAATTIEDMRVQSEREVAAVREALNEVQAQAAAQQRRFDEASAEQTRQFQEEFDRRVATMQQQAASMVASQPPPPPQQMGAPPVTPPPMYPQMAAPMTSAAVHPADVADVAEWDAAIETDAQYLVLQLESRWVSGSLHLPGGRILGEAFEALRLWILATACVAGWGRTPQRELGNHLLRQVLLQIAFVRDRVPRAAIERHLAREDATAHPVMRAAAAVGPGAAPQTQHTRPRTAARAPQQRIVAKAPARAPGNGRAGGGRA